MTSLEYSPERLVNALIDEANRMGGLDNIAVIVVRIDGGGRDRSSQRRRASSN